nr:uncharacterized protein LOC127327100 isoform X1 [Lolium perenne]XP_051209843.1 uncharacterized protein LOC127327100 isoform X2 [Lolium perenne]
MELVSDFSSPSPCLSCFLDLVLIRNCPRSCPGTFVEAGVVEFIRRTVNQVAVHVDVQDSSAYARRASARGPDLCDLPVPPQSPRPPPIVARVVDLARVGASLSTEVTFAAPPLCLHRRPANASIIGEEGEDLGDDFEEERRAEDREEVHGQIANQGKPPLDACLILIILLLHYHRFC